MIKDVFLLLTIGWIKCLSLPTSPNSFILECYILSQSIRFWHVFYYSANGLYISAILPFPCFNLSYISLTPSFSISVFLLLFHSCIVVYFRACLGYNCKWWRYTYLWYLWEGLVGSSWFEFGVSTVAVACQTDFLDLPDWHSVGRENSVFYYSNTAGYTA